MALTTNLISYWKMDNNSTDSVGSVNGSDTNITYNSGNGIINQGAGFNGTNSKIAVGESAGSIWSFTASSPFSISFWTKNTDSTSFDRFFSNENLNAAGSIYGYLDGSSKISLVIGGSSGGGVQQRTSSANINDGAWHHIVVTWSGSVMTAYMDGSVISNTTGSSGTPSGNLYNNGNGRCIWGARWSDLASAYASFLTGALDECATWTRELTSGEVTQLYNSGAGLQYPFISPASGKFLVFM